LLLPIGRDGKWGEVEKGQECPGARQKTTIIKGMGAKLPAGRVRNGVDVPPRLEETVNVI